jgi:hypothetical protein
MTSEGMTVCRIGRDPLRLLADQYAAKNPQTESRDELAGVRKRRRYRADAQRDLEVGRCALQ